MRPGTSAKWLKVLFLLTRQPEAGQLLGRFPLGSEAPTGPGLLPFSAPRQPKMASALQEDKKGWEHVLRTVPPSPPYDPGNLS